MIQTMSNIRKLIDKNLHSYGSNWKEIEAILRQVKDINMIDGDDDSRYDTLLSEVFMDLQLLSGKDLLRMIKLFVAYGYDFSAHGGINGAFIFENIHFLMKDNESIEAVKWLLCNGADPNYNGEYLLQCDLLPWVSQFHSQNNLQITLQEISDAYKAEKDFHSIYSHFSVIGKTITRIQSTNPIEPNKDIFAFQDELVLWFGDSPLVINKLTEMCVNPVKIEGKDLHDVTSLDELVDCKLRDIIWLSDTAVELQFADGKSLCIAYNNTNRQEALFELVNESTRLEPGMTVTALKKDSSRHGSLMLIGEHHGYYVCSVEMLGPGGKRYSYIRDVSSSFGDTVKRQVNKKELLLTDIVTALDEEHRKRLPVYTLIGEAEQYMLRYETDRYEILH